MLMALIDSYGIGNSVTITGYVSEEMVREYIAESRAMVLPSFAEGLPMVIMEAFAALKCRLFLTERILMRKTSLAYKSSFATS